MPHIPFEKMPDGKFLGFSYDKYQGFASPWGWLNKLACRLFGHPAFEDIYAYEPEPMTIFVRCMEPQNAH